MIRKRALFITTQTVDMHALVDAWDAVATKAHRMQFDYHDPPIDDEILAYARGIPEPEVIFYCGGCGGLGLPSYETFRQLRKIAPLINMVPDATDPPWHRLLDKYREQECFDLHVALDGDPKAPVDFVTITPVDFRHYEGTVEKDIHCGFSGSLGAQRTVLLEALGDLVWIRLRAYDYTDHARFFQRCRLIVNTAWTGSGLYYHVKGRVLESGWARSALLEHVSSPTKHWYPVGSYFPYANVEEARRIIETAHRDDIAERTAWMAEVTREKYHPSVIYSSILEHLP